MRKSISWLTTGRRYALSKSRLGLLTGSAPPEANVDRRKQRQITRAARAYRRLLVWKTSPTALTLVSILLAACRGQRYQNAG